MTIKYMERLLRFDRIRASKLLEIMQSATISLILSIYMGVFFDKQFQKIFGDKTKVKNKSILRILMEIITQFCGIVIIAYYIGKIVGTIPFMFSLDGNYIPNMKGESGRGVGAGTKIVFFAVQDRLKENLGEMTKRIRGYI